MILVVVALAAMREGSETVLFLFGVATSGQNGARNTLMGGLMELDMGAFVAAFCRQVCIASPCDGSLQQPVDWYFC